MKSKLALFLIGALLIPSVSLATNRLFTYSYESRVLTPGEVEFEPWSTFRIGRDDYFNRFDQRFELETGITDQLQTSLYLNTKAITEDTATGRTSSYEFDGISSEWKYKFLDPFADALGFALYGEGTFLTSEIELEQRFIFDKEWGNFLAALNVTSEFGWDFSTPSTDKTYELELDAGLSYPVNDHFSVGLELKNHNEFPNSSTWAHSALFLGPVVSYSQHKWWGSLTVLPQVVGLKGATTDHLVLGDLERIEVRLLFGIHL